MDIHAFAQSTGLAKIVSQLEQFITNSSVLRRIQSLNATKIVFFSQGVEAGGVVNALTINGQPVGPSGAMIFSFMVFITDELSGRGRYQIGAGPDPSGAGAGFPIPSGGTVIEVSGWENIRSFRWINETGETLNWTVGAFQ